MARSKAIDYSKFSRELLYEKYILNNTPRKKLALELGIGEPMLRNFLKHYDIKKPSNLHTINQKNGLESFIKENPKFHSDMNKGKWQDSGYKEKLSKLHKDRWGNEEYKKTILAKRKELNLKQPESQKEKIRQHWKDGRFDAVKGREKTKEELDKIRASVIKSLPKRNATMKKNNSYGTSKPEEEFYNTLSKIYEIERQYRSKEYPWSCDFYFPQADLYIELNLHWTHGDLAYTGSREDLEIIKHWDKKQTKYYQNAIYVWTDLDVRKRISAKTNKLNYIEVFNIQEMQALISKLTEYSIWYNK